MNRLLGVLAFALLFASRTCAQTAPAATSELNLALHELSPWTMFLAADILVKAVMVSLAFASLLTWTIFFAKWAMIGRARRSLTSALNHVAKFRALSEVAQEPSAKVEVLESLLSAAKEEMAHSGPDANPGDIKDRAASRFAEISRAESRSVREGMGALATIGSTAPFVGLFGTVWGIMNSFIGISKLQTTNLAVVAPGIAEALLATATGLAAAIPAVMIYNFLARRIRAYSDLVGQASGAVARLLSREIERAPGARENSRGGVSMAIQSAYSDDEDDVEDIHDINVTPFIDVILVLLIIFMIAAPLSTVDVAVDLPSSSAAPPKRPDKPIYLTIKPDLTVSIGEAPAPRESLLTALDAATAAEAAKDSRIFIRADRAVAYGELMNVLEILRIGGYRKVSLVAQEKAPEPNARPGRVAP